MRTTSLLSNENTTKKLVSNGKSLLESFEDDFTPGQVFAYRSICPDELMFFYQKVQFKFKWHGEVSPEQRHPITYLLVFTPQDDPKTHDIDESEKPEVLESVQWNGQTTESQVWTVDPDSRKADTNGQYELIPVELIRDDALRTDDDDLKTKLDDWPESGPEPRSPKYLFAQDDNIFVRVTGPQGMGNDKIKVKVTSESDTSGITFDLAEASSGVYINKSPAKPLRLGDKTETKSDCVTIKVVDEEVLTFTLIFNGVDTGKFADVMVDRGEFASCGINVFYGNSTGDRTTMRTQAITNTKLFDVGDGNYPDNVVAQGNAMKTFIKNAGENKAENKEADLLSVSSHGEPSGDLGDNDSNNSHTYTGNTCTIGNLTFTHGDTFGGGRIISPSDISNSADWNNDVEWVMLLSCLQLNPAGGGSGNWDDALYGNPRRIHAILGAYKPFSGDLRSRLTDFWTDLRDNRAYIIDAYTKALGSGSNPEPWAYVAVSSNMKDRLKELTRDRNQVVQFSYLDATSICGRAGAENGPFTQVIDGGRGLLRTDIPSVQGRVVRKGLHLSLPRNPLKPRTSAIGKMMPRTPGGRQDFIGRTTIETASIKSSLAQEEAAKLAENYISAQFPELATQIQLKEVSSRVSGTWQKDGKRKSWTNGYLVQFSLMKDDLPIFDSYVNVTINGNSVDGISFRAYNVSGTGVANTASLGNDIAQPMDARVCMSAAMSKLRPALDIQDKYEVLSAELCYVNQSVAEGGEADLNREFVPAWHYVINTAYKGPEFRPKLFHVWLDPATGNLIGKKPY